jgi:hypothetical protein
MPLNLIRIYDHCGTRFYTMGSKMDRRNNSILSRLVENKYCVTIIYDVVVLISRELSTPGFMTAS